MSDDKAPDQVTETSPQRAIRSFVIRAGRATAAQERALVELWPTYGVEFANELLDLDQLFGRHAERMIEIGFGAGEALLSFAIAHPEMDCLGLEVHGPGVGHLLLGLHEAQLTNTRIIRHDAVDVLEQQVPAASIAEIHVFFPDPWPKKRHHKRRLIQTPFIELLARVLKSNGVLRLATDWEHYALHMRDALNASPLFENLSDDHAFVTRAASRPVTRFEQRGQRLGHGVWDLAYRKRR
jgi:tRNA (guanine-N7-)-methyltransferase